MSVLPNNGEIEPASIAQIRRGKDGRMIEVTDDVANVARDLHEIDPRLRVRYSEAGEYFVVYCREDHEPPGDGYLVTTCQELDQRVVNRIRRIADESYDFVGELDRIDAAAERAQDHRRREQVGEVAERLSHALRKDRGIQRHIFVPGKDGPWATGTKAT